MMFEFLDLKKQSTWIIIFIFSIVFVIIITSSKQYSKFHNKENFGFLPWNMGTRFYPSYDIRGYPQTYPQNYNQMLLNSKGASYPLLFPWNYPYPGLPYLYWSPYFYEANGKFTYDKDYAKALKKVMLRPLST